MTQDIREQIAQIVASNPESFRPRIIAGDGLTETDKERHLRVRNSAYYKADTIIALFEDTTPSPPVAGLTRALEPLAVIARLRDADCEEPAPDDETVFKLPGYVNVRITMADCRRALAALSNAGGSDGKVWIVEYLRAVGDAEFDSAWSTEAKAREYLATKEFPGHWNLVETKMDKGSGVLDAPLG